jgi:hypothetical protein
VNKRGDVDMSLKVNARGHSRTKENAHTATSQSPSTSEKMTLRLNAWGVIYRKHSECIVLSLDKIWRPEGINDLLNMTSKEVTLNASF